MNEPPHTRSSDATKAAFRPVAVYENLDFFRDRVRGQRSEKSPSLLALHALTHSKPELAKQIFEDAVMEPFMRLLTTTFPAPAKLSNEATKRVEDLRSRFLQEPIMVVGMLEAIFVIERVEPWARDTVKLMSHGKSTFEQIQEKSVPWAEKFEANGCALATMDLASYVRERDYRIMLGLVTAIDGRSAEDQAKRILDDLPVLKAQWDAFGDGTTSSLIGPDGAKRLVSWIMGYIEF